MLAALLSGAGARAQNDPMKLYKFTTVYDLPATSVKNQAETGTCWCHATLSFLESELIRKGKGEHDLSEMFIVRHNYVERMADDYLRKGKGNVSEGAYTPNVLEWIDKYGIVPEEAYNGINYDSAEHNHRELNDLVHAINSVAVDRKHRSPQYYKLVESLFDIYLGKMPDTFKYEGKTFDPKSFAKHLGLDTVIDDYVMLTSVAHHPFYKEVPSEWADNWNHWKFWNVPIDQLMDIIDNAIKNGYTVCWSGALVKGACSCSKGIAINPEPQYFSEAIKYEKKYPEIVVTQENRQSEYEDFKTTDDHAMHITGILKDQDGTIFYKVKDSFATDRNPHTQGYVYMSRSYMMMRTITILVHKDAVPASILRKL